MAGAFRDELEAARSRAEALRDENESLREEVLRLRGPPPAPTQPREDPELARLAESTLERLEELTGDTDEAETSPPASVPPLPAKPSSTRPARAERDWLSASVRIDELLDRAETAEKSLWHANEDREELRRLRRIRTPVLAATFVAGVMAGIEIARLLHL